LSGIYIDVRSNPKKINMRQLLTLLLFAYAFVTTNGQKYIEILQSKVADNFVSNLPENLNKFKIEDLQNSTDSFAMRIWRTNEILTIKANSSTEYECKFFIYNDRFKLQEKTYSGKLSETFLDSLKSFKFWELKNDNFRGIDGSFIFFEISTKKNYKICSFWSPESKRNINCKIAVQTLDLIDKLLNTKILRTEFVENLEPETYSWGTTTLSCSIDRFLGERKKTDFYISTEHKIRTELNITDSTSHRKYSLILINDNFARISDLNRYNQKDILNIEILKPDNMTKAIYGTNGNYGIVKVKTKKRTIP
jgi:hypothetical protein